MSEIRVRRAGAFEQSRAQHRVIDTRTTGQKTYDFLSNSGANGQTVAISLIVISILSVFAGFLGLIIPFVALAISKRFLHPSFTFHNLPFRVPKHINAPDGSNKYQNIKGPRLKIADVKKTWGNATNVWGVSVDKGDNRQLWLSNDDLKTHALVIGGTGSGKTELLYNLALNQLTQDSGFIYTDAKGDITLQARIIELLRRFDRFEDLLTITFAAGGRDLRANHDKRLTNTYNIMSSAADSMLIEVLSGMVAGQNGGKGDVWQDRCLAFVAALTQPLVFLRNKGVIDLGPTTYVKYLSLDALEDLAFGEYQKIEGFDVVSEGLRGYFNTLPGWTASKKGKQSEKTLEQHGYITMQLTKVFNDLGYNYGHIFNAQVPEIDVADVVLNRRCLTILLPALERSEPTLLSLGSLIFGSIKQMMASSLGASVEGSKLLIIDARPTNARNVFRVFLDEVGYMMVPGMAITVAQARSLNIAMTFASQTFSDLKKGNESEAEAIWGNTSIKLIGTMMSGSEHGSVDWQKISGLAGMVDEVVESGYVREDNFLGGQVRAEKRYQVVQKNRINPEHLQTLRQGEFVFFGAKKLNGGEMGMYTVCTFQSVFVAPDNPPNKMQLNDLVPISRSGMPVDYSNARAKFKDILRDGGLHKFFRDDMHSYYANKNNVSVDNSFSTDDVTSFYQLVDDTHKKAKDFGEPLAVQFYSELGKALCGEVKRDINFISDPRTTLQDNNIMAMPQEFA